VAGVTEDQDGGQDPAERRRTAVAAVTATVTVTGLAVCAAAGSYSTVSGLAASHGIRLDWLAPAEIDGGLVGVILLDITLTWANRAMWWMRLAARVFGVGTVLANAAAGWPSPVGAGLRCAAPLLIVVITEAGRASLLYPSRDEERKERAAAREKRREDWIPPVRWLLDPAGTFRLWRRMKLRGETSYSAAAQVEENRRMTIGALAALYGPERWRSEAPDLAWMIEDDAWLGEAAARVRTIVAAGGRPPGPRQLETHKATVAGAEPGGGNPDRDSSAVGVRQVRAGGGPRGVRVDEAKVAEAKALLKEKPELRERGGGVVFARELGLAETTARRLLKQMTAPEDGNAVDGNA
jgi:hypothetical protein